MKKLMSWLFYWSFYYMKKWKKKSESLEIAYFLMVWLHLFNLLTMLSVIGFYIKNIWGISISIGDYIVLDKKDIVSWLIMGLFCSPILIGNYIFVYNKKRRANIDAHYTQMSASKLSKSKFLFWVYFSATIILFFSALLFIDNNRDEDKDVPIKQELNFDNFPSPR